ncbi:Clo7bot family Cys-rich peptide [Clostridium sp. FAM 1755]|nr:MULTISPECIES: Clo7bot family Cys-rich peptide [Clostridium]EJP6473194.1 Clo7bot family Cys-rich peptide [Clostridium botulinum]NFV13155.1 Clo7bot family Cys-rich peptide [Clostridium sporogenes]
MKFIIKPKNFREGLCHCDHCDYCSLKCASRCGIYA